MKSITKFESFDGKVFASAEECKAHEAQHGSSRLVALTAAQVEAALTRSDLYLADAIERAGVMIAKLRRESGDLKRRPKKANENAD